MRLQAVRRRVRRTQAFLLALAMLGAVACSTSEEPPVASNADGVAPGRVASVVYFDEDGNRIDRPPNAPAIAAPSRQGETVPEVRESTAEGGGMYVELAGRGTRYRVATKDASGNIRIEETHDTEAFVQAKQAEGAGQSTPNAEEGGD